MEKIPKQWLHWCRTSGIRPSGSTYAGRRFYPRGLGRMWRLNNLRAFECGPTYGEFDRWASCDRRTAPMPTSRAEFVRVVGELLDQHDTNQP